MDESEESKALTPLGNERRNNPGQTKVFENTDGTDMMPGAPSWDSDTPLEDIASQYTGIGGKYNDLVENAADNVGDRQVQLVGNDFGATNPYMFNTYYEPAATTFASKMRMEGTQAALEEGLERGAKEAQNRLNAAQQRYNNAVAAQKAREEQQRNANAYISETDTSKLPQGTNERDLINSVEFQNMPEADKKSALEDARIHDMQDTLTAGGVNIDWNDKNRRTNDATNPTLEEFGYTRDQYNGWSQEEKDAFWARKDVGNAWTRRYMESYYRTYYPESADMLVTSFNDIRNDVNAIVDAYIKDQNLNNVSNDKFYTSVPVPDLVLSYQGLKKSLEASEKDAAAGKATFTEEERNYLWSILNQYEDKQDEFDKNIAELQLGYRKMNEEWHSVDMTNPELEGHPVLTFFDNAKRGIGNNFDEIPDTFTFNDWWNLQHLVDAFDGDKKGEQQAVTAIADELGLPSAGDLKKLDSDRLRLPTDEGAKNDEWFSFFGKGTYYPAGYVMAGAGATSNSEREELLPYRVDDVFESAYGVDYQSIDAIATLKETSPEDYEYLMNQAAFIMNIKDPIEIVEDENKEYFINGEYKKLQKGDLVFHTVDGTIIGNPDDENYFYDTDAKNYIDLYRSIYNGTDAASEENLSLLEKYYNQYRSNVQAAMALSGMYGVQANEDIYAAIVLVRDKSNNSGNKKLIVNPFDPNGEKITYNEFKNWWEGLDEDSRKNAYVEIAKKARQTRGHYYIAGEYGGIKDVRGGKSNGVDVIGTYGKSIQQDWYATKPARAIQALSNEDCLALNIILDTKMREGDLKQNFMDNDEIPVFDQIVNDIGGLVDGTIHFIGWGLDSTMAMVTSIGDQFAAEKGKSGYGVNGVSRFFAGKAGKHWDEMTTIDKDDDSEFLQSIGLNDMVMGNRYTQEVRNQQRANLNHLIDTTFNIDYFDPENTYDEKTGEMRNKDGKVIALFDNHYFHTDQARALAYMGINLIGAVAEFAIEEAATAGIGGLVHKGAEFAMKKSPALAKASVRLTTAVGKGYSMRVATKLAQLERGRKAAQAASAASKVAKGAAKKAAKGAAKGASSVDDIARTAGRTGAKAADNLLDDAAKTGAKSADNVADNIVEDVAKRYTDSAVEAAGKDELGKLSEELASPLKGLDGYTLETRLTGEGEAVIDGLTAEQRTRNAVLDTVINATDEGADLTVTQKIVNKIDDVLDKTFIGRANNSVKNIINGLSGESAFTVLQRSAMNVRIAEASGVAAERVAQLSDDAAGILYGSLLRAQGGSGFVPGMGFMGRDTRLAGSALKEAGLDFKGAVEQAADQSFRLAKVGGSLSGDDTIRILAQNSKNKNALISALKRDSFIKDRLVDWAQDIRMNYYTPYLDEDFNSDYTDIGEYISDPTQWLAGAAFDASVTGAKRLSASYKLFRTNSKINKIIENIDVSPTSAVDRAKLAKQITKLNSLRVNADRLSNQMLDNHISVTKVTEVRQKATDALDKQMSKITDSFDFEKSLDFMTNNLKEAAEKTTRWDKIKDRTGFFGRSRVAQAQDLNRYLLKSNQSLEAFWTLSQAQQADAVIKFAEVKSHTRNMSEIDSQKWARSVSEGFKATQDMPVAKIFGDNADVLENGTINIKNKEKAKELVEKGQTILYDEIYNALARNVGDITNLPALRSELNWVRDQMIDYSKKAIDNGQKVRWNYFPTQGIMFEGISDTPMALVGFYYGSGLHPDVSNKMANPNLARDTWDFAEISQNILDGKDHYTQQIGAVEKIQNAKKGIANTTREVPYNMDFFNPAYALQAYSNTFESKQFAAKMLDPMQNGHVVVRSDSVLDGVRTTSASQLSTFTEQRKAKLTEDFKKARAEKNKAKIETIKKDTQDSIAKAEKSLTKKTSKDVDKANTRILKEQSRAEKKVVESDLFKGYARYSGLEGKANSTIAKQMSNDYGQVVKDIAAVRAAKGSAEVAGVSAEYRKNGIYKQNVDALAKSKTLTKDVLHQNQTIRIGGSRGADLNSNALKKPFYNTIASLQQTKKVDAAWNKFVTAMKNSDAFSKAGLKAEDFVRSYPVDTTDLRKRFSDDIYKIVNTKFGVTNDFTGNLKLNDNFRKTLNQYIGDAYDTVLGRKAAGEGIALAEVIEELNNLMPSLELAKSAKYNDFMATLSAYQNSGGSIEDLRTTILVECANLRDQGLLDTPEGRNLIGTIRILDEAAEGSERISNMSSEGKFTSVEEQEEQFGDSVFGGSEDANPEKAMMAREDEAERLASEAPRGESLMAKVLREYSSDMDDVQRYKALKSTIEYLDKNKTKVTENMTFGQTLTYNKDGFAAFHSQVEAPYKSIAKDFQEKVAAYNQLHPKRPIKLTDADTKILNPPKKGILEGISDNQYLKLKRQYNNGAESFKIGKKTYTRAEFEEAVKIGTDGRGIIEYYNPNKLKDLIDRKSKGKKLVLDEKAAEALEKLTGEANIEFASGVHYNTYDEFKDAFTSKETRGQNSDNFVNMRTAIERNLADNKSGNAPLINLGELAITSDIEDATDFNYNTININGKDGSLEITLVPDYGTRGASDAAAMFGESNNTAVGYHLDVEDGSGKHTQFANFEELSNSDLLSDDFAGDSVALKEYFEKETGNKIPQATDQGRDFTQHFGKRAEEQEPLQWTPQKRTLKQDWQEYKSLEPVLKKQSEAFWEKYGMLPSEYPKYVVDPLKEDPRLIDYIKKKYSIKDLAEIEEDFNRFTDLEKSYAEKKKAFSKKSKEYEELGIPFEGMTEVDAVIEAPNAKEVNRLRENLINKRNAINEKYGAGRKARSFAEEFKDQYKNLPHEPKDIKALISDSGIDTSEKTNSLLKRYEKSFKDGNQDIDVRNELKASLVEDAKNTWHNSSTNEQKIAKPDKNLSKEELAAYKKDAEAYNAILEKYKKAKKELDTPSQSAQAGAFEASTAGHKEFSALNAKFAEGTKIMGIDIGGRTIEDVYQKELKGSGKGKAPAEDSILGKATADAEKKAGRTLTKAEKEAISQRYYDRLWDIWGEQNPELKAQIENLPAGTKITDQFAKTNVSQANSLQRWVKPVQAAKSDRLHIVPANKIDAKAAIKGKYANKFIGYGIDDPRSATSNYAKQAGAKANVGEYEPGDTVFVSIPGKRGDATARKKAQDATIAEAMKAIDGGATLITDSESYVNSSAYNEGEARLAKALKEKGCVYRDFAAEGTTIGLWRAPSAQSEAPAAAKSLNSADSEDVLKFKAAQQKEFAKTDNYRIPKNYETEIDGVEMRASADEFFNPQEGTPTLDEVNEGLQKANLAGYTEFGTTGRAYKNFADSYGSLQESVLDFPCETSDLNMDIAESNLNTFLYGSKNGAQGHFDRMGELTTQLNNAKATADDIIDNDITDKLSSLKKLDGSSYEDIVEQLKAIKTEIDEVYANTPEIRDALKKRIDDEIDFTRKQIKNDKQGVKRFIEHDADYRNITEATKEQANLKAGAGETIVHNINGTLVVGNSTTMPNRISLADLRTANEVVEIEVDKTRNPFKQEGRRRQDKKVLKDMRNAFNDGYEIKGKISGNTQRQKEAWIDDLAAEVRERTGNPDLPESEIFVDKQMANLGQFYFKEGRQGWQESLYRKMSALSEFNKTIQDFHLAGGIGQYNAFTLRNAITMMWQDPVGGTKALFTNFRNAKDNTSVMKYFLDNHEKMLKYAIDSDDYSIINAFAPIISMDERLAGGGIVNGVINQVYGAKNTFREALEREGKFGALKSVPRGIYEEIFNNPTFARWTIIAKADMQMRNYAKAEKFVNKMIQRYGLSDEDFANMEGGMGGKDEYIATLARMRTDRFWNPSEFALSGFSAKKYLTRQNNKVYKETFESLKGIPRQKSLNSIAGDFFFAVNYKLQMNAHPINGMGSMVASVFTVPRASFAVRNGNLAPMAMRFAGRGDRTQAAIMVGIAALAHVWNTSIGAPSAWEELWGDHGNKDNGTYGMAQSLLNFQDFGKFWIPNDGNGGFDPSKPAYAIDPFFSIFTLQNSAMRGVNKFMNPNQVPINWQRTVGAGPISIWNGTAPIMNEEPTSFGTRLAGVADEWIGANLLAGYKAIYEVMNNSTYFGNNIWERKYLPDGTVNKNYNPVRNLIASVAHILNLDSVLEGKSPLESGTNRWVKGLTIEEGRGWQIGEAGVRQDKIGTVSGSGLLQHEYATALGAIQRGDYFDALTESLELPFKSRNYAAKAKTALNQEVMLALRQELHKYEKAIDGASTEDKDKAYAEFANATVNIMHDWSAKYGNVLGTNDELTSSATKIAVSFLAGEYNDATSYVQNMYDHLRQELKMADGDQFLFSKEKMQQAISSGMSPEEAAATHNKHLTALKNAQIAEYEARKALIDAGINIDPDKNLFDSTDILHADFEAKRATVNKKLLTEIRGKLESQVGEFKNFNELKAYYESLIDEAGTTKQKAKLANEYNKYVEDVIAPYLEEYGENVLNSAYWDGDYVSNHLGKYLIIPADKTYKGKTPHSNYLKDEFGVGYRDSSNLPSDEETKEALARASRALSTGRRASAKAIVDNALVQFRQGRIHASNEDREKLLRLRAMLSSRSN